MIRTSTVAVMALNTLLGLAIPAVLYFLVKKKLGQNRAAFFTGCGVMLVFAFVLESLVHSVVLGGSLGTVITGNILLYALYGGAMAGIFEETGRFVAFRFLLKKYRQDDNTAIYYGAGHGGFETFYILFFSGVNNLAFALMVNAGNLDLMTAGLRGDALAQVENTVLQMQTISPWVLLLSPLERVAAILIQLSLSVFVWFGVKEKRYSLLGLSVLLHFLVDAVTVVVNQALSSLGNGGLIITEAVVWVMALAVVVLAKKVWRAYTTEKAGETLEQ